MNSSSRLKKLMLNFLICVSYGVLMLHSVTYVILFSCGNSSLVDFKSTKIDSTVIPVLSSL